MKHAKSHSHHVSRYTPIGRAMAAGAASGAAFSAALKKAREYISHLKHQSALHARASQGAVIAREITKRKVTTDEATGGQHNVLEPHRQVITLHKFRKYKKISDITLQQVFSTHNKGSIGQPTIMPDGYAAHNTGTAGIGDYFNVPQMYTFNNGDGGAKVYPGYLQFGRNASLSDATMWAFLPYPLLGNNTGVANTAINVAPRNTEIIIKRVDEFIQVTNFASTSSDVRIYWFLCKKTCATHPMDEWQNYVLSAQGADFGQGAARLPGTSTSTARSGYIAPDVVPDMYPVECPGVKKFWKLVKEQHFSLDPGDTHKFHNTIHWNKLVKKETVSNANSLGARYLAGVSLCAVIMANGVPVVDTTAGDQTNLLADVTQSASDIGVLCTRRFHFAAAEFAADANYLSTIEGILNQSASGVAPVVKQIVDTDAVGTVTST